MSGAIPKVALVTGAARRIGRAIALALGGDGWAVGVHYNTSGDDAEAVVAEIAAAGGRAQSFQADLSRESDVAALVPRVASALGPLGCLVNNASLFEADTALSADRASWDAHMDTNLRAPFLLTQHFARQLPDDAEGSVINVLDERVLKPTPYFMSYTLSKSALWTATQTLALALAPRIRVNGVGPGPTLPSHHQSLEQFAKQQDSMPLRRGATPEEIAGAVRFLLATPSMTGQMLALDGGQHLGWAPGRNSPEE